MGDFLSSHLDWFSTFYLETVCFDGIFLSEFLLLIASVDFVCFRTFGLSFDLDDYLLHLFWSTLGFDRLVFYF